MSLAIGEAGARPDRLPGVVEPGLFDDVDPELLGIDMLPRTKESIDRNRQAADELVHRAVPDTGLGDAGPSRTWSPRPPTSGCGRRSSES